MANTYSQINIHVIFSVKGRENLLTNSIQEELYKYITGILKQNKQYSLAVNGAQDHVHIFFELHPTTSVSDIVRIVKSNSSKWIKTNFTKTQFNWQEGYGVFSHSKNQRKEVINYIVNQQQHHKKKSFKDEYLEILKNNDIKYEDKYIFEFYS